MGIREVDTFSVKTPTGQEMMIASRLPSDRRLNQAILLIHGSGFGWQYWDIPLRDYSIMDYLAGKGLDVYAVECRGYGQSSKPCGRDITLADLALDLQPVFEAIRNKSRVKHISAAGHSSGGMLLLRSAVSYKDFLHRMILIGTPYKVLNKDFQAYLQDILSLSSQSGNDYLRNIHHQGLEERLGHHDDDVLVWYKNKVDTEYSFLPIGVFLSINEEAGSLNASHVTIPTLIFNGSAENVVDQDDALALLKHLGTGDKGLILEPDSHHLPFLESRGHVGLQESIFYWVTKT
jgi:alpha-beta hydrolase superfamily lysophospholipase